MLNQTREETKKGLHLSYALELKELNAECELPFEQ